MRSRRRCTASTRTSSAWGSRPPRPSRACRGRAIPPPAVASTKGPVLFSSARFIVATALTVLAIGAPAAGAAQTPELAGTTTITGRGYVDVNLPRQATIDLKPASDNKTFAISGGGKVSGVLLREFGPKVGDAPMAMAWRVAPSVFCFATCPKPTDYMPVAVRNEENVQN